MLLTSRITISSFLVAAMSVYACVLLSDAPARAQQASADNKTQSAGFTHDDQRTTGAQSSRYATLNTWPLADFVSRVFKMHERGEIDLSSTLEIIIEGDRDSEGILRNVEITQKSGDPALKQFAEELVTALNDSRVLTSLAEAKHLRLQIDSNKNNIAASASYEAESKTRAMQTANAYGVLLYGAAMTKRWYGAQLIYQSLHASSNGNEITIAFSMPRETFCALLSKYLSSH